MKLRYLVPALGLAALTTTSAMAEDKAPMVSFQGWVDAIVAYSDDDTNDDPGSAKDESAGSLAFTAQASLKATWNVTDALSAKVNLWFDADSAEVLMREAYFAWAFNDTLTWSMGKYIDHIGWIAAEPTGLYTINASLIGYTETYGNDVLGTALAFAPKGAPVNGSVHITNGYYTGAAGQNGYFGGASGNDPRVSRENTDLGFGLDLTYMFPDNMGNINFDFAYDMHSDINAPTTDDMGGDVLMLGLNATITAVKNLTLGAEIQYLTVGDAEDAGGTIADTGADRLQGMVLANYALEGMSFPMSVSAMVQYVTIDYAFAGSETEERLGAAVALLTNPLGSSNFGLNYEIDYFDETGLDGLPGPANENSGFVVSIEGLTTF